jgi:ABC-2 type transport system ATP-binding protein
MNQDRRPVAESRSDTIIQINDVAHRYGSRIALHGVSLDVRAGEAMALLGPNGSGKTTLFRILSTLVSLQDGQVSMIGLNLATQAEPIRRSIGVVFQSPSLDKQLTARENLMHHGHLYGLRGAALDQRIDALLQRGRLADRAGERVSGFSGGMRRRVEVAKALLTSPRILLLDEPSTGLDPVARQELWRDLEEVRKSEGVTVLLTTHLLDEAERCDRVAIMDQGRLIACDTPAALKERVSGDVITIGTSDPAAVQEQLKSKLDVVAELAPPRAVRFERPRGHEFIPRLIEALPGLVDSVSVGKPTLEDVFVHLTGRGLVEVPAGAA